MTPIEVIPLRPIEFVPVPKSVEQTIIGSVTYGDIKPGDIITIAGRTIRVKNPNRHWYQFWKPKMITTSELEKFAVIS